MTTTNATTSSLPLHPRPLANVSNYDNMVLVFQNQTYCDWRVTVNCENGELYVMIYQVTLFLLLLLTFACCGLLYYRLRVQKCTIFAPRIPGSGNIRPNPIETFLIWEIFWLLGRLLFLFVLKVDLFPNRYLIREFLQAFPDSFGTTGFAWFAVGTYLQIGIHLNSKARPWRPDYRMADRFLLIITVAEPLTTWSLVALNGYVRDSGYSEIGDVLIGAHYALQSFWHSFGAMGAFYFGREICNVLQYHIDVARTTSNLAGARVINLEAGLRKVIYMAFKLCIASSLSLLTNQNNRFAKCCTLLSPHTYTTSSFASYSRLLENKTKDISTSDSTFEDDQTTVTSTTQLQRKQSKFAFVSTKTSSRTLNSIQEVDDYNKQYSVNLEMDELDGTREQTVDRSNSKKEKGYDLQFMDL
ncbi:6807_t:CDS:2 [Ambispora gerdemannii]|uniref:6807_t:CDS:1 n=1 Tax=Ambispora gerdemannii TaxID=144530 RepID=A0A9N8WFE8_9GLOM|nr:6807_t:CDS:2 [Ambispora gerdemannii]